MAQLVDDNTASLYLTKRGEVSKTRRGLQSQRCTCHLSAQRALALVQDGKIAAIVFGPLNNSSLKLGGMKQEDELRWFADQLNFKGRTSEINVAGPLWTGRATSHTGIEDGAARIIKDAVLEAIELTHRLR